MVSFKHITVEEAIALADGRYVLLPVTEEHIKNCPECAAMIKSFSDCKEIFAEAREFIPAVEEAKVAEIAAKSFANLPFEEENEPEKEKGFSLSALFASWFKPALAFSLALAGIVAVTLFNREKPSENTENEVEIATAAGAEAVPETKEDYVSGERESGAEVKLAKATISVISKTYLDKVSDTDVTMKSGKAKFDVVTGNDFRIDVDGKFLVRVLGTSFTLDYSDGRLTAEVFSGLVEIIEKSNGSATQLSKDMNRTFEYASNKDRLNAITTTGKKTKNNLKKHDFALTPGKSFLFQGREALAAGKTGAAQQLFTMEIEKGKEPDKALFELVSIHESKKDWGEIANLVKKYGGVMRESRVYKEELMIKGCISQKRSGNKALPLCHDYLREFPRSFRSREIKGIIDEK
ncbi:FecR domain-containing protein [bacterium]|nr:FecR domain-containing protein [bacterium]